VPACPANGPPGTVVDTLCAGAIDSCAQAGQIRFREYVSVGNGPWSATGTVCLGPAEFQQANTPLPPLVVALDVWRRMLFPDPKLTVKPSAGGLANLDSYFWISGPFTQSVTASAGPNQVTVDATATSYEWRFGDGSAPLVTGVPGRPWPARSEIAHAYRQLGRYPVQVTVRWQGRFRVNGGPAQDVPGPPVVRTSTVTYPVRELQTVLTR
jgi:PKD domain